MPSVFSSHMVIQHGQTVRLWGKSEPGGFVVATVIGLKVWGEPGEVDPFAAPFVERQGQATVDEDGHWSMEIDAFETYGHYEIQVSAGQEQLIFEDVLVGEVWLASGQSNMHWAVANSNDPAAEIAAADYPGIRIFQAPLLANETPVWTTDAEWKICSPQTIRGFSAVAYFFGRALHQELNVPIGLLHTSWGGTPVEAWTSLAALESDEVSAPIVERTRNAWNAPGQSLPVMHANPDNTGLTAGYARTDFDDEAWTAVNLPGPFEELFAADQDGVVWFRRTVALPETLKGQDLTLSLGPIDDADVTYVNGEAIGETPVNANAWDEARVYTVPARVVALQEGQITIAIRAFDRMGGGGLHGEAAQLTLGVEGDTIELAGPWQSHIEHDQRAGQLRGAQNGGMRLQDRGEALYNGMILPYAPYAIKGAIWYQGESNAWRAVQYRTLMPMMIRNWRELWNQADDARDFPFAMVLLANFQQPVAEPGDSQWAELREAQIMTVGSMERMGAASAIDIGQADDIHPRNKQDVGARLSVWALATEYDRDLVWRGPSLKTALVERDAMLLELDLHGGESLALRGDGPLSGFALAGEDGVWHWADSALILGPASIMVRSAGVPDPVAVRYAWSNNPTDGEHPANLTNDQGLPAEPFRSDDWPVTTENNR